MRPTTALVAILLALWAMVGSSRLSSADEHLRNGSFNPPLPPWVTQNATVAGCAPADGGTALRLAPTGVAASAVQRINGPLATGMYQLTGRVMRSPGSQNLQVVLSSHAADDVVIGQSQQTVVPSESYADFQVDLSVMPNAASARLELRVLTGVVCVDSLSLDGPPLATATPEPTNTPAPSATSVPSTTTPSPTPTATATRTAVPALVFRNGSFEDGASGWQHFGGDLDVTTATKVSGLYAGVLSSTTASTKWAYQTVAVDPQRHYEFRGYLLPAAGVVTSLLRVSWYATSDGSGEALGTVDSTAEAPGGATGYAWLTTGPVQPPPNARTARARVLLTPAGSGPGDLFMDDLEFLISAPPAAATAVPTSTPLPAAIAAPVTAVETRTNAFAVFTATVAPSPAPTRTSEVSSTRIVATPLPLSEVDGTRDVVDAQDAGGLPLIWLVGGGALFAGLGGAYLQGRRKA